MNGSEIRGFLVTGCNECPFVGEDVGGYDRSEILSYFCKLYSKEFENPDWDERYMYGCRNKVPTAFPKFCQLKRVEDKNATIHQKYKRIVGLLKTATNLIEER
jgi:hypothetical protein